MRCSKVRRLLGSYLDGDLDLPVAGNVEQHVGVCPACAEALRETRQLEVLFRTEQVPPPPLGLVSAIRLAATTAAPAAGSVSVLGPARVWLGRGAMATAGVLLFLGGSHFGTLLVEKPGDGNKTRHPPGLQELLADTFDVLPGASSMGLVLASGSPSEDDQ